MSSRGQGHRHGVTKNLVEGVGGLVVGAALVLLLRQLLRPRGEASRPEPAPKGGGDAKGAARDVPDSA